MTHQNHMELIVITLYFVTLTTFIFIFWLKKIQSKPIKEPDIKETKANYILIYIFLFIYNYTRIYIHMNKYILN